MQQSDEDRFTEFVRAQAASLFRVMLVWWMKC
jgi:hypothetical protein